MTPYELIRAKRDGRTLAPEDIRALLTAYARGEVPDAQMAALCMAVWFRGLAPAELRAWTEAMLHSGSTLALGAIPGRKVDKHSTGGVGDKVSLCLAPLVAACGAVVPMVSGRGLGHTGGTLDKLASIPGFRTDLSLAQARAQLAELGVCMLGQTEVLAPADRRLYALRDVTATVQSIPLIATSIMSKKVASGASRLVLDVKVGEGAFMPDLEHARELAGAMIELGAAAGLPTTCMLTRMDEPLGRAVGNALEVAEAVDALHGRGPDDLMALCLEAAAIMTGDRAAVDEALRSGAAHDAYRRWIAAQGGDPDSPLPQAPAVVAVPAQRDGVVRSCHALRLGEAAMRLGAGRARKEDTIDHAVGIVVDAKAGERVQRGQSLATVHARSPSDVDAGAVGACFEIGDGPFEPPPVVIEVRG